eukprot:TRINITY_DN558_c0_g1_i3.p1 TRINITY_DN558_c0_g1~~TRINITY_DN558_c0_g1_i3.p1  ORF type:complete len:149 (-),score=34.67 TRINITY_DN558_c0_g1_i3:188-634(-)
MGSRKYSTTIDIWSAGCIFAEMATGKPLFPGSSAQDQLLRIFKLLGTPTEEEWPGMVSLSEYATVKKFPVYPRRALQTIVPGLDEAGYELLSQMLQFDPNKRITSQKALVHPYFDDVDKQKFASCIVPSPAPSPAAPAAPAEDSSQKT